MPKMKFNQFYISICKTSLQVLINLRSQNDNRSFKIRLHLTRLSSNVVATSKLYVHAVGRQWFWPAHVVHCQPSPQG